MYHGIPTFRFGNIRLLLNRNRSLLYYGALNCHSQRFRRLFPRTSGLLLVLLPKDSIQVLTYLPFGGDFLILPFSRHNRRGVRTMFKQYRLLRRVLNNEVIIKGSLRFLTPGRRVNGSVRSNLNLTYTKEALSRACLPKGNILCHLRLTNITSRKRGRHPNVGFFRQVTVEV